MSKLKVSERFIAFLLVALIVFMLAGCGSSTSSQDGTPTGSQNENSEDQSQGTMREDNTQAEAEKQESDETGQDEAQVDSPGSDQDTGQTIESENTNSDILVIYFSRTGEQYTVGVIDKGNTAIVAEMIADKAEADIWEVLPVEDVYPMDSYDNLIDIAKEEQNDNARPAYQGDVPDLSQYSTVFIGAPVWWGDWPMIMYTFFENEDLSGKTLIPFSTHEGSGLSSFDKKLASACPDSVVLDGLGIRGNDAQNNQESVRDTVNDWLSDLGY